MFSGPKPTSSSTSVPTIWLSGFWNTIPAVCLTFKMLSASFVSMPSTYTVPSVGITSALRCFANVDLPEPLCPNTATKSPALISILTLSTAVVIPSTLPSSSRLIYSNVKFLACTIPKTFSYSHIRIIPDILTVINPAVIS